MAGTIDGKVVDGRNYQPLSGARVSVQPGDHSTTSGHDGTYNMSLDAGTYAMEATINGYDPFIADGIVVIDDVTTEINIALPPNFD